MTEPIRRLGPLRRSTAPIPPITLRRVERDDPEDREDREDAARQDLSRDPGPRRPSASADGEHAGPAPTQPPRRVGGPDSPGHVDVQA